MESVQGLRCRKAGKQKSQEALTIKHSEWTEADSRKCKQIWAEYQKQHDITERIGQTAGIDPKSGQIWFGDSALDIVKKRETEGLTSALFFERVGYEGYFRKVGRRVL